VKCWRTDDGRKVMAIAHMTLWVRWAKNGTSSTLSSKIDVFWSPPWTIDCISNLKIICSWYLRKKQQFVLQVQSNKIIYFLYLFLFLFFFCDTLTSKNMLYRVVSGFIFWTDQSTMSLPILEVFKSNTWELLSNWSIHLIDLCMIGWSMMNERSSNMNLYGMSLAISLSTNFF